MNDIEVREIIKAYAMGISEQRVSEECGITVTDAAKLHITYDDDIRKESEKYE